MAGLVMPMSDRDQSCFREGGYMGYNSLRSHRDTDPECCHGESCGDAWHRPFRDPEGDEEYAVNDDEHITK